MNTTKEKKLDKDFREAVEKINNCTESFPADQMLRLYAYYKIATKDSTLPRSKHPLISAFKTNALFQARNVSEKEAKENYIALVRDCIK